MKMGASGVMRTGMLDQACFKAGVARNGIESLPAFEERQRYRIFRSDVSRSLDAQSARP
jgi:hypothetical protein